MWPIAVLVMTTACGRIAFDARGDGGGGDDDGGRDGAGDSDGTGLDAFLVPHATPFSTPMLIPNVNSGTAQDIDPSRTGDNLEMYFASDRTGGSGGKDIWRTVRVMPTGAWPSPIVIGPLSSAQDDQSPELSRDGLELWFSSNRTGSSGSDLWFTARTARSAPWATPVRVTDLASAGDDHSPSLSGDRLTIIFDSTRDGGLPALFQSTRSSTSSTWSVPVRLTELDAPGQAVIDPALSDDGLTLFFGSGPGSPIVIYSASRASVTSPFTGVHLHTELTVRQNNTDAWLSPDGRRIVFSAWDGNDHDLFEATR